MNREEIEALAKDVERKEKLAESIGKTPWIGRGLGTSGMAVLEYDYFAAKRAAQEARAKLNQKMNEWKQL